MNDYDKINERLRQLECFNESFNLMNFIIQPHVMHIHHIERGKNSNLNMKLHFHRTFECSIILSGKMTYTFEDTVVETESGTTVIISPLVNHCWTASEDAIVFSLMLFISCHGDGSRESFDKLKNVISRYHYQIKDFEIMIALCKSIICEISELKSGYDEKIQCYTREIYVELLRKLLPDIPPKVRHIRMPPKRGDISASIVELVRYYVQDNIAHPIKISDISRALGISMYHLCRVFKENYGLSIQQYITSTRIERALNLLVSTDRSLKDIATSLGYDNPDYFCRIFRKQIGMTPSQYRKKNG